MLDAEVAQPREPAHDRLSVEAELRDDMQVEPGLLGRVDLGGKRAVERIGGDARMTVGIAGDADLRDAVALQQSALDQFDRAAERPGRAVAVARDDEQPAHAGLAAQATDEIVERIRGRSMPHGNVRHRLETRGAQVTCRLDHLMLRARWYRAEINTGT